jgi:hypothetical protein
MPSCETTARKVAGPTNVPPSGSAASWDSNWSDVHMPNPCDATTWASVRLIGRPWFPCLASPPPPPPHPAPRKQRGEVEQQRAFRRTAQHRQLELPHDDVGSRGPRRAVSSRRRLHPVPRRHSSRICPEGGRRAARDRPWGLHCATLARAQPAQPTPAPLHAHSCSRQQLRWPGVRARRGGEARRRAPPSTPPIRDPTQRRRAEVTGGMDTRVRYFKILDLKV